jgi:hypothetical protein
MYIAAWCRLQPVCGSIHAANTLAHSPYYSCFHPTKFSDGIVSQSYGSTPTTLTCHWGLPFSVEVTGTRRSHTNEPQAGLPIHDRHRIRVSFVEVSAERGSGAPVGAPAERMSSRAQVPYIVSYHSSFGQLTDSIRTLPSSSHTEPALLACHCGLVQSTHSRTYIQLRMQSGSLSSRAATLGD